MGSAAHATRILLVWAAATAAVGAAPPCRLPRNFRDQGGAGKAKLCGDCFADAVQIICSNGINSSSHIVGSCCHNCTYDKLFESCELRHRSKPKKSHQQSRNGTLNSSSNTDCARLKNEKPNFMADMENLWWIRRRRTLPCYCRLELYKMCPSLEPPVKNCKGLSQEQVFKKLVYDSPQFAPLPRGRGRPIPRDREDPAFFSKHIDFYR